MPYILSLYLAIKAKLHDLVASGILHWYLLALVFVALCWVLCILIPSQLILLIHGVG